ncbi:MAG: phospholipase D-like domain-containing protein [Gammaproteobacteria bacterium]
MNLELYPRGWRGAFLDLLSVARKNLTIVSPYIRRREAAFVAGNLRKGADITALTRLEESGLLSGALEIGALDIFGGFSTGSRVINLPRLHAKIYVADESRAIITSANLTTSGMEHNYEYGVGVSGRAVVRRIRGHVADYAELGHPVAAEDLARLSAKVADAMQKQAAARKRRGEEELRAAVRAVDDECQTLQSGGYAPTVLFARAVRHLLKDGAMTTRELQDGVLALYPGLCANGEDRIINGRRFGKLWKHHLRNAQQGLKKSGEVVYDKTTKKWTPRFRR